MIPNDNKEYKPPKRFSLGSWWRETEELFYSGYFAVSKPMREYRRQQETDEDRKYIQERLEWQLYTLAESGSYEEKLQVLKYFQHKKQHEQSESQRPYTLGEQISSVALNAAFLTAIALMFSLSANWSCGSSQSQFCKDVRTTTSGITRYYSQPKL